MSLWDSLRTAVADNQQWVELTQSIANGITRIGEADVLASVRSAATAIVDGITETEGFQSALSLSRSALVTADTAYMDAGYQAIANAAGDAADAVSGTLARAQNSVIDAANSYVETFERPLRSWELPITDADAATSTNYWQQSQNIPGGGVTAEEAAAFDEARLAGTGMEDVAVVRVDPRTIVNRMLDQVEVEAQQEWSTSQWGRDRSATFARYAEDAAATVQQEEDARQATRATARAARAAQEIQQQIISDPQITEEINNVARRVNSVYTAAWEDSGEAGFRMHRVGGFIEGRAAWVQEIEEIPERASALYTDVQESEQIALEVLELGRRADPVMRTVNLRLVAGDDIGAIGVGEAEYGRARVPQWQVEWVGEDEVGAGNVAEADAGAELEPLLQAEDLQMVEVELEALEPAEQMAVIAPEIADGINLQVEELVAAGSGGVSAVVGLAFGAAMLAGTAMISTIDAPARIHRRDDEIYRRQVEQNRVDLLNKAARSKIYTHWLQYKTPILHRRSMADANKRFTMMNPQSGLWRVVRVTSYSMLETRWSMAQDHMLGHIMEVNWTPGPLPFGQATWGRVVWPPENETFHIAFQGRPARSSMDIHSIHILHPAPLTASQLAWNRSTLMRRRALLIQNLMLEIISVGNRQLIGAMITHANDIPRMDDDEGILRIQILLCSHHGTMPSDLPGELDDVAGAVIDRWIRVATHLLHVGSEEGARNGWTKGDSVLLHHMVGILVQTGYNVRLKTLKLLPDHTVRGIITVAVSDTKDLTLIDRNPFASQTYTVPPPDPAADDAAGAAAAAGTNAGGSTHHGVDAAAWDPHAPFNVDDFIGGNRGYHNQIEQWAPWVPSHAWKKASRQGGAAYQAIPQSELDILVWTFLVDNHMPMEQVLTFVDRLGPWPPRQMILAFQHARERRDRETVIPVIPIDHNLIRMIATEPNIGPTIDTPRRRRLVQIDPHWPIRTWVQNKLVGDFHGATVSWEDEKEEAPQLFTGELLATIGTATSERTPYEASEYAFEYLYNIIEDASNVPNGAAYGAFTDQWIADWGGFINRFDVATHVLTSLGKDFQNEDFFSAGEVTQMNRFMGSESGDLKEWFRLVGLWDGMIPMKITWLRHAADDTQIMQIEGSDLHYYRDAVAGYISEGHESEREVKKWVDNLEDFGELIWAAMRAYSNIERNLLTAARDEFDKPPGRQLTYLRTDIPEEKEGGVSLLLVTLLAGLAFLLVY